MNKPDVEQLRFWCKYWILVVVLTVVEKITLFLNTWFPIYGGAKLALFVYLCSRRTKVRTLMLFSIIIVVIDFSHFFFILNKIKYFFCLQVTTHAYEFFRTHVGKHEPLVNHVLLELKTRGAEKLLFYRKKTRIDEKIRRYVIPSNDTNVRNGSSEDKDVSTASNEQTIPTTTNLARINLQNETNEEAFNHEEIGKSIKPLVGKPIYNASTTFFTSRSKQVSGFFTSINRRTKNYPHSPQPFTKRRTVVWYLLAMVSWVYASTLVLPLETIEKPGFFKDYLFGIVGIMLVNDAYGLFMMFLSFSDKSKHFKLPLFGKWMFEIAFVLVCFGLAHLVEGSRGMVFGFLICFNLIPVINIFGASEIFSFYDCAVALLIGVSAHLSRDLVYVPHAAVTCGAVVLLVKRDNSKDKCD
ncbi:PREDICTED: uncharacterized protein LOC105950635 isoform X1 [Erythranthe guttata]|uniref:uncharacterized protein LOC105950635 isoform X1 n=1 Tax=Erythranthe guttata TaxID=4155 RepID=UPI00064DF506|nr:PREDICTED: uncharacterized protein LOC105950635 isoform X1 [Erythranthe guttata]|eukprot:XP_012829455.1 PREDICTED: uncharacterized protein LOC105950635 isoform X1 [Erythranthe guttata]